MEALAELFAAKPECAADPSSMCGGVWAATQVGWLATGTDWLIATPLKILLILVVAIVTRWILQRLIRRAVRSGSEGTVPLILRPLAEHAPQALIATGMVSERRRQRSQTIGSVLRSLTTVIIWAIAIMMILSEFGINLAPLLASAGIVGVAVGFGAQNLVRDFLSGMFMILEDQYGVGDIVDVGEATGTVEAVGLRCTTLRDINGTVWYVRNGEIIRVGNKSQGWSMVVVDVPLPYGTRIETASPIIRAAADGMGEDEAWAADLLEKPEVLGIEQLTTIGMTVRVTVKTTTDAQWRVGRELRRRLSDALESAGITSSRMSQMYVAAPAGGIDPTQPQ